MKYVFVDIETTGLDPNYHEPIEVGLVPLDPLRSWIHFSLHFDPSRANPRALEINGWGNRAFPEVVDNEVAVKLLVEMFGGTWPEVDDEIDPEPTAFVAHHAHFDESFLASFLRRNGAQPPWGKHVYDLPSLVAGAQRCAPHLIRTPDIQTYFDCRPLRLGAEGYHSAIDDACWCREVFLALDLWPLGPLGS